MTAYAQFEQRITELVKIAQETPHWGVTHGEKQVYFTPPGASRDEVISMSLHPGRLELNLRRLERSLDAAGLPMIPPKTPAHPNGKPEEYGPAEHLADLDAAEAAEKPEIEPLVPDLTCRECAAEGTKYEAKSAAGLGAHRRSKHGVIGVSKDAVNRRSQKAQDGPQEPEQPVAEATDLKDAQDAVMADVDAAWLLLRAEVEQVVEGLHDVDSVATWQRRAEEAGEVLAKVREAISTQPMIQAYATIAGLVGADRE